MLLPRLPSLDLDFGTPVPGRWQRHIVRGSGCIDIFFLYTPPERVRRGAPTPRLVIQSIFRIRRERVKTISDGVDPLPAFFGRWLGVRGKVC